MDNPIKNGPYPPVMNENFDINKKATIVANNISAKAMLEKLSENSVTSDEWRRYGKKRREDILEKDKTAGGTTFNVNHNCSIRRYFLLSERVVTQFHSLFERGEDVEGTFIMGHRLVSFLSEALPRHPDYMSPAISKLRDKSFWSLVVIKKRLVLLAHQIDEEQLNLYIMNEFDPVPDDDSSASSTAELTEVMDSFSNDSVNKDGLAPFEGDRSETKENQWEDFTGWSYDIQEGDVQFNNDNGKDNPNYVSMVDLMDLSSDSEGNLTDSKAISFDEPDYSVISFIGSNSIPFDNSEPDAGSNSCNDSEDTCSTESKEEDEEEDFDAFHPNFEDESDQGSQEEEIFGLAFLQRIASEEVRYETDSEAVDSWAQDGESKASTISASSSPGMTYDPARIAFREIMNRLPRSRTPLEQKLENLAKAASSASAVTSKPNENKKPKNRLEEKPFDEQLCSPVISAELLASTGLDNYSIPKPHLPPPL